MWAPCPPPGLPPYEGHSPTGSSASTAGLKRHPASPVHSLWVTTLWPLPYGHRAVSAIGPLSELNPVLFSQTSGDACTVSRHTHQWCVSGCVPDELGITGQ